MDNRPEMGSDDPEYLKRMARMISNPDAQGFEVVWASNNAKARFEKHQERNVTKCSVCGTMLISNEAGPFRTEHLLMYGIPALCMNCAGEEPEVEVE